VALLRAATTGAECPSAAVLPADCVQEIGRLAAVSSCLVVASNQMALGLESWESEKCLASIVWMHLWALISHTLITLSAAMVVTCKGLRVLELAIECGVCVWLQ